MTRKRKIERKEKIRWLELIYSGMRSRRKMGGEGRGELGVGDACDVMQFLDVELYLTVVTGPPPLRSYLQEAHRSSR